MVLAGLKMLAGDMSYAYVQKTDNECVMGMGPDTTAIYDRLFLDAVLARQTTPRHLNCLGVVRK